MHELRDALVAVYGTDFGLRGATWISRFTDMTRQAVTYRDRRVLLAGDAAHVHPPHGGQGLQTGVQDAVNLGWKLGQVVAGTSAEDLLDTYGAERHPVGARVLRDTMAQVVLGDPDDRHRALRETMAELLGMDEPRRHIAAMLTGLDIRYDLGEGHPLLGRRVPGLDLVTADGPVRLFALLARRPAAAARPGRVDRRRHRPVGRPCPTGGGEMRRPVAAPLGREVVAPGALLIRPDGHVAWVGDGTDDGLADAQGTWFGPPAPAS